MLDFDFYATTQSFSQVSKEDLDDLFRVDTRAKYILFRNELIFLQQDEDNLSFLTLTDDIQKLDVVAKKMLKNKPFFWLGNIDAKFSCVKCDLTESEVEFLNKVPLLRFDELYLLEANDKEFDIEKLKIIYPNKKSKEKSSKTKIKDIDGDVIQFCHRLNLFLLKRGVDAEAIIENNIAYLQAIEFDNNLNKQTIECSHGVWSSLFKKIITIPKLGKVVFDNIRFLYPHDCESTTTFLPVVAPGYLVKDIEALLKEIINSSVYLKGQFAISLHSSGRCILISKHSFSATLWRKQVEYIKGAYEALQILNAKKRQYVDIEESIIEKIHFSKPCKKERVLAKKIEIGGKEKKFDNNIDLVSLEQDIQLFIPNLLSMLTNNSRIRTLVCFIEDNKLFLEANEEVGYDAWNNIEHKIKFYLRNNEEMKNKDYKKLKSSSEMDAQDFGTSIESTTISVNNPFLLKNASRGLTFWPQPQSAETHQVPFTLYDGLGSSDVFVESSEEKKQDFFI